MGQNKPRCLGECKPTEYFEPVLVNSVGQIYMVEGYDAVEGNWEVIEELANGTQTTITFVADKATKALFDTELPSGIQYTTNNARGLFRLGFTPVGTIKCKVRGVTPSVGDTSHAGIIESVLGNVDVPFSIGSNLSSDTNPAGIFIRDNMTVFQFLSEILPGCGSFILEEAAEEAPSPEIIRQIKINKYFTPTGLATQLEKVRVGPVKKRILEKINTLTFSHSTFTLPIEPDISGLGGVKGEYEKDVSSPDIVSLENPGQHSLSDLTETFIRNNTVTAHDAAVVGVSGGVRKTYYMSEVGCEAELSRIFAIVKLGGTHIELEYLVDYLNLLPNDVFDIEGDGQDYVVTGIKNLWDSKNKIYGRSI